MTRCVAFLRAINVGGHTVTMDRLRAEFEALDVANVETFIASGNVIFETASRSAAALERRIEARLRTSLGYEVTTFLRTVTELDALLADPPFRATDLAKGTLFIGFLGTAPAPAAARAAAALSTSSDTVRVRGREVYWLARQGFAKATVSAAQLEKTLGQKATFRNVSTVAKLRLKFGNDE
ncbi:MAG: DUF1697 domain-containing protein [Acidobacteriota bacterium]